METDQRSRENPDQENPEEQSASQARSYDCTFCKRGFSNAQALGGHMNIHRKDKAKLKHYSSNETKDIPKFSHDQVLVTTTAHPSVKKSKSTEDKSSIKWPFTLDRGSHDIDDSESADKTHVHEIQKLMPFFLQKSSSEDHQKPSSQVHDTSEESSLSSQEIDLELRLGPERHD